jgi:adenosylmethionine-8-amino-7-oxononanoate aminotransferase
MNSWALQGPAPDCFRCEFNCYPACTLQCLKGIETLIEYEGPQSIAAVIGEPISMSGGMAIPPPEYWKGLRALCDRHGILLIADEVICGFGRTGKWFGIEHWGIVPDLMTVAKSLSSGYAPIGACIVRDAVFQEFAGDRRKMFVHVSTFGGHAVAAAAALKNLEIYEREGLVENSRVMGAYLLDRFKKLEAHPTVMDVRGIGLWIGFELVRDKRTRAKVRAEDRLPERMTNILNDLGVVITRMGETVQVAPPLCITREECDELFAIFDEAVTRFEREIGVS